jgi:hypothetical protein
MEFLPDKLNWRLYHSWNDVETSSGSALVVENGEYHACMVPPGRQLDMVVRQPWLLDPKPIGWSTKIRNPTCHDASLLNMILHSEFQAHALFIEGIKKWRSAKP